MFQAYCVSKWSQNVIPSPTDVTVKNAITEFKAQSPKTVVVKFAAPVTATKDAFTLTDAKGVKVAIKTVSFDETKQIATVEFYNELSSGTEYTVSVKLDDDTYTEKLNFVKGEVAQITAADQTVKADSLGTDPQSIKYTVLDENGLDITDSTAVSFESNVSVSADGKISITDGVIAYVTVVYTNPKTGVQIKSNQFTVKGSNSAAASVNAITIDDSTKTIAPDKFPTTVVTTIAKGTTGKKLFVLTADQFGTKLVNTGVSFESLDPSVFVVDAKTGAITTIAEGIGQVKVTAGSVSNVFTITVTAAAKETSLVLDAGSVTKAMVGGAVSNDASVTVNVLDQSGNKKNDVAMVTYELTAGDDVVAHSSSDVKTGNKITVKAGTAVTLTGKKEGTAYFKVTSDKTGSTYIMVPVTVYANDNVIVKYGLDGVKDFDIEKTYLNPSDSNYQAPTTVNVYGLNANGFKVSPVSGADVTITAKKGNDTVATTTGGSITIQGGKITGFTSEGEYTLTATQKGTTIATATFKITDSGVKPGVTVKKNEVTQATFSTLAQIRDVIATDTGYTVEGIKFVSGNTTELVSATNSAVTTLSYAGSSSVTIYNVVVVVKNTTTNRSYDVATNQSIKINK